MKPGSQAYVPELDGIRGLSILVVMIYHAGVPYVSGGFIGVDMFFVLSGFLITSILVREYDLNLSINLKDFYIKRVLRLMPALLLMLLSVIVGSCIFLDSFTFFHIVIDCFIALYYCTNWARAFLIHPPTYLGHAWSLSIEEQFYIGWPLLLMMILRKVGSRRRVVCLIGGAVAAVYALRLVLIAAGASVMRLHNGLDTKADALLIGCALGILVTNDLLTDKAKAVFLCFSKLLVSAACLALLLISMFVKWASYSLFYWGFVAVDIATAILVLNVFVSRGGLCNYLLRRRGLAWVGRISYGLYLYHYPIYRVMNGLGCTWVEIMVWGTALSFTAASLSFYLLEQPVLNLRHKLLADKSSSSDLQPCASAAPLNG